MSGRTVRWSVCALALSALAVLTGCASMNNVANDVTSYSHWPAERKPTSYAFERLPSQQAQPQFQDQLEQAAQRGLEDAGFTPASNPAAADVNVQLSSRIDQFYPAYPYPPYYGRFGWYGGYGPGRFWGPGMGMGLGYRYDPPYYEREVSVLIRDRKTGAALYESRARSDGTSNATPEILQAMFVAALKDFPRPAVNPRRVVVPLQ